jgi:hypothetical protein
MNQASDTLNLTLPQFTVDTYGRITSVEEKTVTIKDTTYSNGTGLSLSAANVFSLNQAGKSSLGGIKLNSDADSTTVAISNPAQSTNAGGTYEVRLTNNGVAYVNVPWKNDNTTYSLTATTSNTDNSDNGVTLTLGGTNFTS